jgi:glucosamine-6-phosphate isomerase
MQTLIYNSFEALSEAVADKMVKILTEKPNAVFCLASGSSPGLAYQYFVKKVLNNNIDYSKCTFIGLDEWIGIPPNDSGSCHYFLQENIFKPLNINKNQINLFDGLSDNLEEECNKTDQLIRQKNGIDLIIVGIGLNGHIGFNEPGISPDKNSHVIELDELTKTIGQKYFDKPTQLSKGITIGLAHFMEAREAILMANGIKKAAIIHETVNGKIDINVPSTIIQTHKNAFVMVDEEAANLK